MDPLLVLMCAAVPIGRIQFGVKFGQNPGYLFAIQKDVIWPFDLGSQAGLGLNGAAQRSGRGDGDLRDFLGR